MNYQPRPVIQGFVAYTPALQSLNAGILPQMPRRPHFVMLCQQATDGRFPALEDSAALNYVLNNYVPVARDGRFLILQQRTAEDPAFQLVHEETCTSARSWICAPGRTAPCSCRSRSLPACWEGPRLSCISSTHSTCGFRRNQEEERYRIVPSMAERPFLVNPLLNSNYDVMNFYASHPGKEIESVTFERPRARVCLNSGISSPCGSIPRRHFHNAARRVSVRRMLADVQGRVFWPQPASVESTAPARLTIFHGTAALVVRAPSKIVVEIPANAASFSGYFGMPEEADTGDSDAQGVGVAIVVNDASGKSQQRFDRFLKPLSRADDRGRFSFRIPIDSAHDRTVTLTTEPAPSNSSEGSWSVWSQCRFEESRAQ